MCAAKTPLKNELLKKLAALNDQFCFYLFIEREFSRRLVDFSPVVSQHYTTDVFAANEYAPKIHIRLDSIPQFQLQTRSFTFGAYFSTGYEIASDYFDDSILRLIRDILPTYQHSTDLQRRVEWTFYNTLQSSLCHLPDIEIIETLTYFRLRRNHFIHVNDHLSTAFQDFVNNRGGALNAYWRDSLSGLDFTNAQIFDFSEVETIDSLKLFRVIIERLDTIVASSLNNDEIVVSWYMPQVIQAGQRMNADVVSTKAQKIRKLMKSDFDSDISIEDVSQIIRQHS